MRLALQLLSLVLGLVGTWSLAFGLRVREGVDRKFRKELHLPKDHIVPSEVYTRPSLFWLGLALITLAAALQAAALLDP